MHERAGLWIGMLGMLVASCDHDGNGETTEGGAERDGHEVAAGACGPEHISEVLTGFMQDINGDGVIEAIDGVDDTTGGPISTGNPNADEELSSDRRTDADFDQDGFDDTIDYDDDGKLDNRFFFNDAAAWVPDLDSFDDYEDPARGLPRGVTPVPRGCPADGIETGPPDLGFDDYRPSRYCPRNASGRAGEPCTPDR